MSWYETSNFEAPLEVLHKKCGSGPQLHFFLELELVELYILDGNFIELVEWSNFLWRGVLLDIPILLILER
jgi:hypothetical protein